MLALSFVGLISYWSIARLVAANDTMTHTQAVINHIDRLMVTITTAETVQRGYLLSGDLSDLEAYWVSSRQAARQLETLRAHETRTHNRRQLQDSSTLETLMSERLAKLERGIRLRQKGGVEAASRYVQSSEGSLTMRRIRAEINDIEAGERAVLMIEISRARDLAKMATFIITFGLVLAVLVVAAARGLLFRNLIERELAESELHRREERFRALTSCSPVGIFLLDSDGRATYFNPRCLAIGGFALEEGLGYGWVSFVHPEDRKRVIAGVMAAFGARRDGFDTFRVQSRCGIVRRVQAATSPMLSDDGAFLGYVGTLDDVSERERAEEVAGERGQISLARRARVGSHQHRGGGRHSSLREPLAGTDPRLHAQRDGRQERV